MRLIAIFIFNVIIITCSAERGSQRRGRMLGGAAGGGTRRLIGTKKKKSALHVGDGDKGRGRKRLLMRDGAVLKESVTTAGRKIFHHYQSSLMH